MESLSLRERIAMTIATRDPLEDWCGNPISWADISEGHRECYRRDADAILAIPGIAVVQLPGQMGDREEVPEVIRDRPMWEQRHAWATIEGDGLIYFENGSGGSGYGTVNAAEARDLAAALLAAADYAERDQ